MALTDSQKVKLNEYIKKYIDINFYDFKSLINYLEKYDVVNFDVFQFATNNYSETIRFGSYPSRGNPYSKMIINDVHYFNSIDVDTFIRRIPFYFYYPKDGNKPMYGCLRDLIFGYIEVWNQELHFGESAHVVDYEPMYKKLEEMFYAAMIPLEDIFEYVHTQVHTTGRYDIWLKWYKYIGMCLDMNDKSDLTPKNILWSYNDMLERQGLPPIIYRLENCVGFNELYVRNDSEIVVGGELPINPNTGKLETKWVGLWVDNEKYLKTYRMSNDPMSKEPSLHSEIHIGLLPETLIYVLEDKDESKIPDYVDSPENYYIWYPIYIGPKNMKFTMETIKNKRIAFNYIQKDVAERIGVSPRTYQNWEMGVSVPDSLNLLKIMNLLDIRDVQELVQKERIPDYYLQRFKSGKPLSDFLNNVEDEGSEEERRKSDEQA